MTTWPPWPRRPRQPRRSAAESIRWSPQPGPRAPRQIRVLERRLPTACADGFRENARVTAAGRLHERTVRARPSARYIAFPAHEPGKHGLRIPAIHPSGCPPHALTGSLLNRCEDGLSKALAARGPQERTLSMWMFLTTRLRRWVLLAIALPTARLIVHRVALAAEHRDPSTRTARALHRADSAVTAVSRRSSRRPTR